MPTINIIQSPTNPFDMAYGPNPVTLSGLTTAEDKYAMQIYRIGYSTPVADLRQTPNKVGNAVFDIQNVLQNMVSPSKGLDDLYANGAYLLNALATAGNPYAQYYMTVGYEVNGTTTWTTNSPILGTLAGAKEYWEVPFNVFQYAPAVGASGSTVLIPRSASALSDNQYNVPLLESVLQDELDQDGFISPAGVDIHNVYLDDQCTKTWYSKVARSGSNPPAANVNGITAFVYVQYDSNGIQTQYDVVPNIQATGGGPDTVLYQGAIPNAGYSFITASTGPGNLPVILDSSTSHYYVIPVIPWGTTYTETTPWAISRYNILKEPCNDYSHIQFAWMNSKGYRDQFTFTKKWEKKSRIKRNEFLQESADYNDNIYDVSYLDRGYTTYSQNITEEWKATSGFMDDREVSLIESLLKSPDVYVRFPNGPLANKWQPINITSNQYVEKNYRKDRLFQYTINFKLANNTKSQRG